MSSSTGKLRVTIKMFTRNIDGFMAFLCFASFSIHLFLFYGVYFDVIFTLQKVVVGHTFLLCTFSGLSIYYFVSSASQLHLDSQLTLQLFRYVAAAFFILMTLAYWFLCDSEDDLENIWQTIIFKKNDALKLKIIIVTSTLAYLFLMLACIVETICFSSHDFVEGFKKNCIH